MPSIFQALQKAEQEAQQGSGNVTVGEGAEPWKWAKVTIAGSATQHDKMQDVPAAAKEQGNASLFKPRSVAAITLALLFLLAGAKAADIRLRPAAVTTGLPQEHKPNSEADHQGALRSPRWSGPLTLRGEIAHGLNIEMQLVCEGSKLSGSYYYERIGKDIPVQGTIEETGSIVLEEFIKGKKTGVFTGKFVFGARIEGKWSKPGTTRSRDFFLVSTALPFDKVGNQSLLSGDFGHIMPDQPES